MYRATILFKNFKTQGPADKIIVYLTVFIQKCLLEISRKANCDQKTAATICTEYVKEAIPSSTDAKFYMRQLGQIAPSKTSGEEEKYKKYLTQLKEECAKRLVDTIYDNNSLDLKFWLAFGKKPFLGQRFNDKL